MLSVAATLIHPLQFRFRPPGQQLDGSVLYATTRPEDASMPRSEPLLNVAPSYIETQGLVASTTFTVSVGNTYVVVPDSFNSAAPIRFILLPKEANGDPLANFAAVAAGGGIAVPWALNPLTALGSNFDDSVAGAGKLSNVTGFRQGFYARIEACRTAAAQPLLQEFSSFTDTISGPSVDTTTKFSHDESVQAVGLRHVGAEWGYIYSGGATTPVPTLGWLLAHGVPFCLITVIGNQGATCMVKVSAWAMIALRPDSGQVAVSTKTCAPWPFPREYLPHQSHSGAGVNPQAAYVGMAGTAARLITDTGLHHHIAAVTGVSATTVAETVAGAAGVGVAAVRTGAATAARQALTRLGQWLLAGVEAAVTDLASGVAVAATAAGEMAPVVAPLALL